MTWPLSGSPLGFLNVVFTAPISLALLFISTEKSSMLPEIWIAIALAQSFPDSISKPRSKSLIVSSSPVNNPMAVPSIEVKSCVTLTVSSNLQLSSAINAVITFVVEAGSKDLFSFFPKRTWPVEASISIDPSALILGSSTAFAFALENEKQTKNSKNNIFTYFFIILFSIKIILLTQYILPNNYN